MSKELMLGNRAIALGAFEAGAVFASGYPGTPSTEIIENFVLFPGVYAEWAPNEKCAYEAAHGASFAGARAFVTMKHVGLNVAADPFVTSAYTGVNGGLVVVVADDPGMHSSQNEQDSRYYARLAGVPLFEPSDQQEAYMMMKEAFELSEKYDTPVLLRSTTRLSHTLGVVEPAGVREEARKEVVRDPSKYVMVPGFARRRRKVLLERLTALKAFSNETRWNNIEWGDETIGIITAGVPYLLVKEVIPDASVLKVGFSHPLPEEKIRQLAREVEVLLVIEELEPVMETEIKAMGINVHGKDLVKRDGELTPEDVAAAVREALKLSSRKTFNLSWKQKEPARDLPPRPPVLCAGCGHRNLFYVLNKMRAVVMGDIGCYTLSVNPPLKSIDTCLCMGAGIGQAHGFSKVAGPDKKVAAVIGDSTFVHSGITGLINSVYNRSNTVIIILDNRTTAMTGHQPHPGTGMTIRGEKTHELNFEELSRACGAGFVKTVDPYDLKETENVLREAFAFEGTSVVIARRPCVLYERVKRQPYYVVEEKCTGCMLCLRLGCPAISKHEDKVVIMRELCTGCGACAQLCRFDAIYQEGDEQ